MKILFEVHTNAGEQANVDLNQEKEERIT
jgi:hypothetical protein